MREAVRMYLKRTETLCSNVNYGFGCHNHWYETSQMFPFSKRITINLLRNLLALQTVDNHFFKKNSAYLNLTKVFILHSAKTSCHTMPGNVAKLLSVCIFTDTRNLVTFYDGCCIFTETSVLSWVCYDFKPLS